MTIDAVQPGQPELGLSIVPVAGALDAGAIEQVLQLCDVELAFAETEALVIDLAGVSLLEESAVDALVRIRDAADDYDVEFNLHNAADDVREPLEEAGLAPCFGFPRTAASEYSPRH